MSNTTCMKCKESSSWRLIIFAKCLSMFSLSNVVVVCDRNRAAMKDERHLHFHGWLRITRSHRKSTCTSISYNVEAPSSIRNRGSAESPDEELSRQMLTCFLSCFRVCFCQRGDCRTTLYFFCGWNSVDTSLGHWNKACSLGFIRLRKLSRVTNLKHFTVGFVGVICQTTFMIFRWKGAANLIVTSPLRCTRKNQHFWGDLSLIFTSPFTEIKSYVKPCSAENLRRIQGIPCADRITLFRTAVAVVRAWYDFHESSAQLSPLALSFYRGYWDHC